MSDKKTILPLQSRAARAVLDWSRGELAQRSGVSVAALADFEAGKRQPYDRTLDDIRSALEAAGVEFIPENGGGAGVRLKKGKPSVDPEDMADEAIYDARMADLEAGRDHALTPGESAKALRKGKAE